MKESEYDYDWGCFTVLTIAIGFLVVTYLEVPILVFVSLACGLYGIIVLFRWADNTRYKKAEKREEDKIFQKNREKLLSSPQYRLIEGYVESGHGNVSELMELLATKGFEFKEDGIYSIIEEEREKKDYKEFKSTITYNHPTTLSAYINDFIDIYGDAVFNHFFSFIKVLEESGIEFNTDEVRSELLGLKKERKLKHLEQKLLYPEQKSYRIDDLDELDGYDFECFVKDLFEKMGYSVEHTKLSGDQGADLIAERFNKKVVVQVKRYSNRVGNKAIQEVVAAIKHYGVHSGMVVTTSEFTRAAVELAKSNNVRLIDRYELEKLLDKHM